MTKELGMKNVTDTEVPCKGKRGILRSLDEITWVKCSTQNNGYFWN
jgi:hypothetical protein